MNMTAKKRRQWARVFIGARHHGLGGLGLLLFALACAKQTGSGVPVLVAPRAEEVNTDWLTREGGTIAVPMPPKRLERQQTPPCSPAPGAEVEINGGCWSEMSRRAPCGQFYEHEGRCYVPVRETPRPPTSVDP